MSQPTSPYEENPHKSGSFEYYDFERRRRLLRDSIPHDHSSGSSIEITASTNSTLFLKLAFIFFLLGAVAWFFDLKNIPIIHTWYGFLYIGGLLLVTFFFPAQVGGFIAIAAVLFIIGSALVPGDSGVEFSMSALYWEHWAIGIILLIFGGWVASRGDD